MTNCFILWASLVLLLPLSQNDSQGFHPDVTLLDLPEESKLQYVVCTGILKRLTSSSILLYFTLLCLGWQRCFAAPRKRFSKITLQEQTNIKPTAKSRRSRRPTQLMETLGFTRVEQSITVTPIIRVTWPQETVKENVRRAYTSTLTGGSERKDKERIPQSRTPHNNVWNISWNNACFSWIHDRLVFLYISSIMASYQSKSSILIHTTIIVSLLRFYTV